LGERIKVRGKPFEIISTLTPSLSRQRERETGIIIEGNK